MPSFLTFDFYQVEMPNGEQRPFDTLVNEVISDFEDDESRTLDLGEHPVRLQQLISVRGVGLVGSIMRIRLNDLPVRAKRNGQTQPLDLANDEGLGEESVFLYNEQLRALVVQRNRTGVSASSLGKYFTQCHNLAEPIVLYPVLRKSALQQLARMKEIRKIEIRVAAHENLRAVANQNSGVKQVLELGEYLKAPSLSMTVSMGRTPGSLLVRQGMAFIRGLLGLNQASGSQVVTLKVSGGDDDDGYSDVLDLLKYRIVEQYKIEVAGRTLSFAYKTQAIRAVWESVRGELTELLAAVG